MNRMQRDPRHPEGGFSLVEVVIALGILGGVLVSIAGLFVIGTRQVQSGRKASEALAVARTIMEDMQGWGFRQTYLLFNEATCLPVTSSSCTFDSTINAEAAQWQPRLDLTLNDARAEILVESLDGLKLNVSSGLRIQVTVFWSEGERARNVRLSAVRL